MHRALSLLRSSKKSKITNVEKESTAETPPPYTSSDNSPECKSSGGQVQIKKPKGLGCALLTMNITTLDGKAKEVISDLPKDKLMRIPVFAFGPDRTFVTVQTHEGPKALGYALRARTGTFMMRKKDDIGEIYWYSFTPYGDEILAYKDKNSGLVSWIFFKNESRPADATSYATLIRWLKDNVEHNEDALRQSFVVFGPNGSYFARSAAVCTWHDIPEQLEHQIDTLFPDTDQRPVPEFVALGKSGAYMLWPPGEDGKRKRATTLSDDHFLRKGKKNNNPPELDWISLSIDHKENSFLCTRAGSIRMLVDGIEHESCLHLLEYIVGWIQQKAVREQTVFEVMLIVGESSERITISPETTWTGVEFKK